ncbi:MAG: hypothetical protein KJN93_09980, partial [Alphaproteobacteria bacterium]|nr:hypothetical protein [Alphaproteobacteria bacterium]
AKAAVAAAFEAGIEVPKNAQGQAASSIARGVDPAALFAAQAETGGVTAPDVGTDDLGLAAADPGKLGTAAEELSAAGIEPAAVAYSGASAAIAPTLADGAEAALKLLQDVTA